MRSSYDVLVDEPIGTVWTSLTDVDALLDAVPGGSLSHDGDAVSGSLKCKLGSTQITYRISARAEVGEAMFHSAVIAVTGKEARGDGTIAATLTVALRDEGASTRVEVGADVEATGRGSAGDERAWDRVLEALVTGVLPQPPEPPPVAAPAAAQPRPPLAVAPAPRPAGSSGSSGAVAAPLRGRMILAALGIVLLVLGRRVVNRSRG